MALNVTGSTNSVAGNVEPTHAAQALAPLCVDGATPIFLQARAVMEALVAKDFEIGEESWWDNGTVAWRKENFLWDGRRADFINKKRGNFAIYGCVASEGPPKYKLRLARSESARREGERVCPGARMGKLRASTSVHNRRVDASINTDIGPLTHQQCATIAQNFLSWLQQAVQKYGAENAKGHLREQLPETMRVLENDFGLSLQLKALDGTGQPVLVDYKFSFAQSRTRSSRLQLETKEGRVLEAHLDLPNKILSGRFLVGNKGGILPFSTTHSGPLPLDTDHPIYFTQVKDLQLTATINANVKTYKFGIPVTELQIIGLQAPLHFQGNGERAVFHSEQMEVPEVKMKIFTIGSEYASSVARQFVQKMNFRMGLDNPPSDKSDLDARFILDLHFAVPDNPWIDWIVLEEIDQGVHTLLTNSAPELFAKLYRALDQDVARAQVCANP